MRCCFPNCSADATIDFGGFALCFDCWATKCADIEAKVDAASPEELAALKTVFVGDVFQWEID